MIKATEYIFLEVCTFSPRQASKHSELEKGANNKSYFIGAYLVVFKHSHQPGFVLPLEMLANPSSSMQDKGRSVSVRRNDIKPDHSLSESANWTRVDILMPL